MFKAWFKFFRIVNLPTVPGDLFVGAAAAALCLRLDRAAFAFDVKGFVAACVASCALYLFGLADNDIVGAGKDGPERPIPAGAISLGAARLARGLCFAVLIAALALANLAPRCWIVAFVLFGCILAYNRSKGSVAMGLCRGLNLALGAAVAVPSRIGTIPRRLLVVVLVLVVVWTVYIAFVTRYSAHEDADPARRARVGFLIGALVYLQLMALFAAYVLCPTPVTRNLLLCGGGLLILLRMLKRLLPGVSAS